MAKHERTSQVPPFPVPMVRIRRAVLSTGFVGSADRSVSRDAGALSYAFWLQRVSLLRWVVLTMARHPFACAAHRCLRDGIPGARLPGSAVSPRFRPLKTSRGSGGDAVTPAPGGRGLHPHGNCVTKPVALRSAREPQSSFDQRIARQCKRYCATAPSGMHLLGCVCHRDHPQPPGSREHIWVGESARTWRALAC